MPEQNGQRPLAPLANPSPAKHKRWETFSCWSRICLPSLFSTPCIAETSPTRPQPLAQFKGVPTFPIPKQPRPFLLFPQACAARNAICQSVLYTSQRSPFQTQTYHVPDSVVSRPRRGRITSQIRTYHAPDALTSLIFRAFLIINLLVLWNRGYTAFFFKSYQNEISQP